MTRQRHLKRLLAAALLLSIAAPLAAEPAEQRYPTPKRVRLEHIKGGYLPAGVVRPQGLHNDTNAPPIVSQPKP